MRYIAGKENPTDFASRHPTEINCKQNAGEHFVIEDDDELCISRIITSDLPDAVTLPMIRKATANDPVSQKLNLPLNEDHPKYA